MTLKEDFYSDEVQAAYNLAKTPNDVLHDEATALFETTLKTICGPRIETYGPPQESFRQIAEFWQAYLDRRMTGPLTGRDVANMMILMKVSRDAVVPSPDNDIDICGYTAIKKVL